MGSLIHFFGHFNAPSFAAVFSSAPETTVLARPLNHAGQFYDFASQNSAKRRSRHRSSTSRAPDTIFFHPAPSIPRRRLRPIPFALLRTVGFRRSVFAKAKTPSRHAPDQGIQPAPPSNFLPNGSPLFSVQVFPTRWVHYQNSSWMYIKFIIRPSLKILSFKSIKLISNEVHHHRHGRAH